MRVTIREAIRDDTLRLDAFLKRRSETSMFLRSNLRDFGIGNKKDDYAMRYFLRERGGAIQGVGAIANTGTLMMQASKGLEEIVEFMRDVLPDDQFHPGILGDSVQVAIMRSAFGLDDTETTMDEVEPLLSLDLKHLFIPRQAGVLRKPNDADMATLLDWYYAYKVETSLRPAGEETRAMAKKEVTAEVKAGSVRLLVVDGNPVAKTQFNATMPDAVQIGGVFTPPQLRSRGYARLAVALHLAEAREAGVKKAILFSANEYASRAYRGIGFEQIGHYTLTIFATPETKE